MTGRIIKWIGSKSYGFILSEDGDEYFLHHDDCNSKKLHEGNIVSFDACDMGDDCRQRAVNVKKIGHGPQHPFLRDIERVEEAIKEYVTDETEKKYKLNDLQMLKNYFDAICDIEQFPNVRSFRPKLKGGSQND